MVLVVPSRLQGVVWWVWQSQAGVSQRGCWQCFCSMAIARRWASVWNLVLRPRSSEQPCARYEWAAWVSEG